MESHLKTGESRLAADNCTTRWRLLARADLACRGYGDEYVVHHALSNETYRVSDLAGRVLLVLRRFGGLGVDQLTLECSADPHEVAEALEALAKLDLVAKCSP